MSGDGPARIDKLLDRVLAGMGMARPVDVAFLVENWDSVAGAPWADRSRPVRLRDGELTVEAFDATAASLLRYQAPRLIDRLGASLGRGLVTSVVVNRRTR